MAIVAGYDSSGNNNYFVPVNISDGTATSRTYSIDSNEGGARDGSITLAYKAVTSGTAIVYVHGGGGNVSGSPFTGISTLNGAMNDWGTHTVYKNGVSQFTVAGGRVDNNSGSQTASQVRAAEIKTQAVTVNAGDVISIAIAANASVTSYWWYPNGPIVTLTGDVFFSDITNNDSVTDSPTNYASAGNYATMDAVASAGGLTFSKGNLRVSVAQRGAPRYISKSTLAFNGKFYAEVKVFPGAGPNPSPSIGIKNAAYKHYEADGVTSGEYAYTFRDSTNNVIYKDENGTVGTTFASGVRIGNANTMMLAVDVPAGKMWLGKDGTWLNSGDPVTGANPSISGFDSNASYWFICSTAQGTTTDNVFEWNFGQQSFAYTAPTGFKELNTKNLQDIGSYNVPDTFGNFLSTPDLVWIKNRGNASPNHSLMDILRGPTNRLSSNSTNAESTNETGFGGFLPNGFMVQTGDTPFNASTQTYVAWCWNANGRGVSNNAGTIASTVSANPTAGFSIVTWTAQSSGTATVGHGLGVAPNLIIVKSRTVSPSGWNVYHSALGATKVLYLDLTNAEATSSGNWNNTEPTSTVFTSGTGFVNGGNMVSYCFAAVPGYSAFGKYTGNGSTDGPFVYCGFRPRYVLIKQSSTSGTDWIVYDSTRNPYNLTNLLLYPNSAVVEATSAGSNTLDLLSNGFKLRSTSTGSNGGTMIYAAFAEVPFKYGNAR